MRATDQSLNMLLVTLAMRLCRSGSRRCTGTIRGLRTCLTRWHAKETRRRLSGRRGLLPGAKGDTARPWWRRTRSIR